VVEPDFLVSRDGVGAQVELHLAAYPRNADPQVAFTAAGAALFATLTSRPDETGRTRSLRNPTG
jgi:hypothetical protein